MRNATWSSFGNSEHINAGSMANHEVTVSKGTIAFPMESVGGVARENADSPWDGQ